MARFKDREKALFLRKQGKSYSQIKGVLRVSKSTLSNWLRNYPLSKQRIRELRDWNEQRIEKYRETTRRTREERLRESYKEQKKLIFPLTKRERFLAGLFLYWGEGAKTQLTRISISNTDPSVIKFFIGWTEKSLKVPKDKLRAQLHLYRDMNVAEEIRYWSGVLDINYKQFIKSYVKKSSLYRINHKGGFGHGTYSVWVGNARLSERVIMAIKAISDKYNKMRV